MYVTYENLQYCIRSHRNAEQHPHIPFISSSTPMDNRPSIECNGLDAFTLNFTSTAATDFRPTRLLRTSDLAIVPGSEAKKGYCALSYPWEWSGEIEIIKDPYTGDVLSRTRTDHGQHAYIERASPPFNFFGDVEEEESDDYDDDEDPFNFAVFRQAKKRIKRQQMGIDLPKTRRITFEEMIQQLCCMFEIDYIWYDQLCILQSDQQDKQNEIRQMHQIYGNAQFTLVMIPEMRLVKKECPKNEIFGDRTPMQIGIQKCIKQIALSKWAQRTWTFEEAVLSKQLLFVGRNVHVWSDTLISTTHPWQALPRVRHTASANKYRGKDDDDTTTMLMSDVRDESYIRFVQNLCTITSDTISASSALFHIHRGESTEDHDKIFALANIFPRLMDGMNDFSYNQPLLPLMYQFYNNLIQHDLSVLCFGKAATTMDIHDTKGKFFKNVIGVATWTGVGGSHMLQSPTHPMAPTTSFGRYFVTEEGYLSMYSKSITASVEVVDRCPHISVTHNFIIKSIGAAATSSKATMDRGSYLQVISYGLTPTHWLTHWDYSVSTVILDDDDDLEASSTDTSTTTVWFSLVDIGIDEHKRCTILVDVEFDIGMDGFKAYPVITNHGRYRTAIGMCIARNLHLLYKPEDLDLDEIIIR
ncbi:hypothetical protein BDA99DRAFT_577339 [Phascolomyces articulosus]|uniref:Heterokaryon incompatibility domain-containing protein n=1 Tax=Phascolomyces articulosus TaxID=60185 RepID=A0AAD5JX93_9FUNG|nr:hypothetical protein BDA99DRAFT_577339 [Phascolomyces articulosus]